MKVQGNQGICLGYHSGQVPEPGPQLCSPGSKPLAHPLISWDSALLRINGVTRTIGQAQISLALSLGPVTPTEVPLDFGILSPGLLFGESFIDTEQGAGECLGKT